MPSASRIWASSRSSTSGVSPKGRLYLAVEGGEGGALDEWDLVTGVRWRLTPSLDFKLDNALGISSKATDWAPQFGIMLHFPR